MRRYAARVDANHPDVVQTLRDLGAHVVDCAHVGKGFPDLIVCWRGRLLWCEVKDGQKSPSKRKLTGDQTVFHAEVARHGCPVHLLATEADVLELLGARRGA